MYEMLVSEVVDATHTKVYAQGRDVLVGLPTNDTRNLEQNGIFVAFKGEFQDGNSYLEAALRKGASVVVASDKVQEDLVELAQSLDATLVATDDPEGFMLDLASAWRNKNPHWKVVGITGSVGKTTTKEMCAAALATKYKVHATRGNYNSLIGLPITICQASANCEALVLEMGMNHLDEISRLSLCARPDVTCITNIGTAHIGLLGSREAIARTKAEIVWGQLPSTELSKSQVSSRLCLYSGDTYYNLINSEYAQESQVEVLSIGVQDSDQFRISQLQLDSFGHATFALTYPDGIARFVSLKAPGKASAIDAALALSIADHLGADAQEAIEAVESYKPASMRLNVRQSPGSPRVIDDSYNASPASMAEALDVMEAMECSGKKIAVLGEMGEMGQKAPLLHALVGAYAAAKHLDMLCVIGSDLAESLIEGARSVGMSEDNIVLFDTSESALKTLKPIFAEDDLILVKASRSAALDIFANEVLS